jgi:hypothetical protein
MRPGNDQPITAPLGWGKRNPYEEDRIRLNAEALVRGVLEATWGQPEIDILLALGAACPFTSRADRAIWIDEIHRQRGQS